MLRITIALAVLFLSTIAAHADGTWCAYYPGGSSNCGFYSFEQCQATVSGIGGFCNRNPFSGYAGHTAKAVSAMNLLEESL